MASAWVYQKAEDVAKHGGDGASWYCGWYDPDGRRRRKSFGAGFQGKKRAERYRSKVESDLMTGTYQMQVKKLWADFRKEYETRILTGLAAVTREHSRVSLNHFERIVKPVRVFALSTAHVDNFIAERRKERGRREGDPLSPASINKDLRHIKAALNVAVEWGYLGQAPKFRMERQAKKLPVYVTPTHFAAIYQHCETAGRPAGLPYPAAAWWRGLLVTAYMTGWRIGDLLGMRRADLDLEAGTAITRAEVEGNKGKRDELVRLAPVAIEHLHKLPGFDPYVFPWTQSRRNLYGEFATIQEAAGIHLPCSKEHKHTRFCYVYGFHDLRRAFATMNADRLTPDALQHLMRHKSYLTTQVYINMARQVDAAAANLYVPEVLKKKAEQKDQREAK